jgi:hypothetical protein
MNYHVEENMAKFGDYLQKRMLVSEGDDKGSEKIAPESREKEHVSEDKRKPFTYKPDAPMELPQGVMEIYQAFQNKELMADIEAELWKAVPNGKLYNIDKIFGVDEKGVSKLAKVDQKQRRTQLTISKCKLYVVGGAVRDFLISIFHQDKLHKSPRNFNLATDARPKIVQLILMNATPPVECKPGKEMGATVVVTDGETYEIETFREDKPAGNTAPSGDRENFVTYTTPQRDSLRRDFRANALRYDIEKEIIEDDVGGFGDIVENPPKLRTIKPAKDSFKQDPIRAFRGLRLHGKMVGGDHMTMDSDMRSSLQDFDMGDKIDRNKVHAEFMDGLKVADDQNHYVSNFHALGKPTKNLLMQMFPGLEVNGKLNLPHNTHPHVVLALILKGNGPDKVEKVQNVMQKAGFDSSEISDVAFLLSLPKFTNPDQVNEFMQEMNSKAKKLVPTAIRNFAKWAKLPNKSIIDKMLEYRSRGKYPSHSGHEVASGLPAEEKSNAPAIKMDKEKESFNKFNGPKNGPPRPANLEPKIPHKAA